MTVGIGGSGSQYARSIASQQLDGHAGQARFSSILDTVLIQVIPHEIADGATGIDQS